MGTGFAKEKKNQVLSNSFVYIINSLFILVFYSTQMHVLRMTGVSLNSNNVLNILIEKSQVCAESQPQYTHCGGLLF